jgi:apolipoprotein N-acyltransferase
MLAALAAAVAAALLFVGAMRLHGLLAWGVCAPLVLATLWVQGWRGACAVGALFGVGVAFGGGVPWVTAAGEQYFHLPLWLAVVCAAVLALACGATFGALLGAGLRCAVHGSAGWTIVAVGAVWAAWEGLTTAVFPHYPWAGLAATQVDLPVLLQAASLGGQTGLSWAMASAGAALALAVRSLPSGGLHWRYAITALVIVLLVSVTGWVRLTARHVPPGETCRVSAVDAGVSWQEKDPQVVLARYETLSEGALATHPAAIVWPESALPGFVELDASLQRHLRDRARQWDAVLITGGPRAAWEAGWRQRLFNSVYRIGADVPLQVYDKRMRVPFAEYWPLPERLRPDWLSVQEVAAGAEPMVLAAGDCQLGVLVCFEAEQPGLTREAVRRGADALLVLSNDAQLPEQAALNEVAQAQLRAVETGVPVLRAANRGPSVLVDRYGTIVQRSRGAVLNARLFRGTVAPAVRLAPLVWVLSWIVSGCACAATACGYLRPDP